MTKDIATPKQSGGGGFTFEDKVSASFLLKMLAGIYPLHVDAGKIESVRFQKRVDGWFLDDLVLFLNDSYGENSVLTISVKSNSQITSNGFPKEFSKAIWEQFLHVETDKFNIERDYFALVTSPLDHSLKTGWDSLLTKAMDADPDDFGKRISTRKYSNNVERGLFQSLHCPEDVDSSQSSTDTVNILKRLRHYQYDFTSDPSMDENACISQCNDLLRDGGTAEAPSLWIHLKEIARKYATSGGDLTRAELGDRLRKKFSLNEFPDYKSDWSKIADDFIIQIERVRDKLAGKLLLSTGNLENFNKEKPISVLVGKSGSGKTVLAKQTASNRSENGHAVWITPTELNSEKVSTLFSELGLRYSLVELIAKTIVKNGVIIVDGFERLNQTGLQNLATLLRRARIESSETAWSFLFTCVVDFWEEAFQMLQNEYGATLKVEIETIEFQFNDHRSEITKNFPNLLRMLQLPHLSPIFSNLKVLDLVLTYASNETDTTAWIGETDILDWYWKRIIAKGRDAAARSRFIQKMSCIEAEQFLPAVPIGEFESDECRLSSDLVSDQVLWHRNERFGFEHDLLGDWARTRLLLSHEHNVVSVIREKSQNPRWHRAIRLHGLRLLENQSYGKEAWLQLIYDLTLNDNFTVESDLILESVVFAANAEIQLQTVWSSLCESMGALLHRLLSRFLHVATLPDPIYTDRFDDVSIAALHRYPFWPLWLPVLRILFSHRVEAICLSTDQVTQIADLWLKESDYNWPLRKESSRILVDSTSYIIKVINEKEMSIQDDLLSEVFARLLTASTNLTDEVADLVLSLVERRDASLFAIEENIELEELENENEGSLYFGPKHGSLSDPWPDGPLRRINDEVHSGFLNSKNPLQFLIAVRPESVQEILLALLIREPLPSTKLFGSFRSQFNKFLRVPSEYELCSAMFFHGPFLRFLDIDSQNAIETIVKLTNFTTERWLENHNTLAKPITVNVLGEDIQYYGSSTAYFWYRDLIDAPRAIVPALMAFERWCYQCLEDNKTVKAEIQQILQTSNSTAVLGVLVAVGRRYPELFCEELQCLVPLWELQIWEENYQVQDLDSMHGLSLMDWVRKGEFVFNMVRDWHTLEHRKQSLGHVLLKLFIEDPQFRVYMKDVISHWSAQLSKLQESENAEFLERIILQFDEQNWKMCEYGNEIVWEFIEPEERKQRLADARDAMKRHRELLTFPLTCRKMIDERKRLSLDKLEDFWQHLQRIGNDLEQAKLRGDTPEHAILGGIAVLYILHREWLEADDKRDNWCLEQFIKILNDPPSRPEFYYSDSISNYFWSNFSAMLIPEILAEAHDNKEVRTLVAEYAFAFNYSVVHDLMHFAFEIRDELQDDFFRLQVLILISSGIRNVNEVAQGGNSIWYCPDVESDIYSKFDQLKDQFVNHTIPTELPSLCDIAIESNQTIFEMVCKQHEITFEEPISDESQTITDLKIKCGRGFEPLLIKAGFKWLEKIELETDLQRRTQWISTIENILYGFLRPLKGIDEALNHDEDGITFFEIPPHWDTWIFQLVATVIPKMEHSEQHQKLWEPILSIGVDRPKWVDAFLSAWFIHGLKIQGREENFFHVWKEMISFAWSCENWRSSRIHAHHSVNRLFLHLMGFSRFGDGYFNDKQYQTFIAGMKPEFDKWREEFFSDPEAVSYYARFLTFPSAVDHLRDGIRRLAQATAEFQDWHWDDFYYLERSLLDLLEHDWKNNSQLLKNNKSVRQDFLTILKPLLDRQSRRALELQDRISRAR